MRKDNNIQRDNGSIPASPLTWVSERTSESITNEIYFGLTKREQFAMAAMQGILANFNMNEGCSIKVDSRTTRDLASDSVYMADALLAELAKEKA